MRALNFLILLTMVMGLAACGGKFRRYSGPEVTRVEVHKSDRKMYLLHDDQVLKEFDIALGFAPVGDKEFEGDGKTPEGVYRISLKNPESNYHLSLKISYPNTEDRAYASSKGRSPGGDIFIHGGPRNKVYQRDWTAGCIALSDKEMEQVYAMIEPGTPIFIYR